MTDIPMALEPCLTGTVQPACGDPCTRYPDLLRQGSDDRIDDLETIKLAGEWL